MILWPILKILLKIKLNFSNLGPVIVYGQSDLALSNGA